MASRPQRGPGRGLDAILGGSIDVDMLRKPVGYVNKEVVGTKEPQDTADILRIPEGMIEPNPFQPRKCTLCRLSWLRWRATWCRTHPLAPYGWP